MIKVDGIEFDVNVLDVDLDTEFLYKYANRTEDFGLHYELGAIYFNQSITFGMGKSGTDFARLWSILSDRSAIDAGTGHNVEIWTPIGKLPFLMYPNGVKVKMVKEKNGDTWWSGMKVKFIAVNPSR